MAHNDTIHLIQDDWTLISKSGENITAMRVQNVGEKDVHIMATVGETPPSDLDGSTLLKPGIAIKKDDIAALFEGVTGATRYYAYSSSKDDKVSVDHA